MRNTDPSRRHQPLDTRRAIGLRALRPRRRHGGDLVFDGQVREVQVVVRHMVCLANNEDPL